MAAVSLLRAAALGLVVLASALPSARPWSKEGHVLTCQIAQGLLEPDAAHAVRNLLPDDAGGDLSALCVWPDQVRHWYRYMWTGPLHFIDTPDEACSFDYSRDCHGPDGAKDMCVAGAIANFTSQLLHYRHGSADRRYNLTEALLFLSHFMGDVHQPMHVGFTSDQGGNSIELRWFRHKSNLHHVWDREIIQTALADFYGKDMDAFRKQLEHNLTKASERDWLSDSDISLVHPGKEKYPQALRGACSLFRRVPGPTMYATESIGLACKWAYSGVREGETLSDDYFDSRLPIVSRRIAQGGVRLAMFLNRIFGAHNRDCPQRSRAAPSSQRKRTNLEGNCPSPRLTRPPPLLFSPRVRRYTRRRNPSLRRHRCPKCVELKLPRENAAFCPLRPHPISKMRVVPDEIEKPDWALDGTPKIEPDSDLQKSVEIKTPELIERMRVTCRIAREVLDAAARVIKPGITTDEIDRVVHEETLARGGYPSPLNYYFFPKSCCTSVNEVICHGIPDARKLEDGDIVNVDVTVYYKGVHGDLNETYFVGNVDEASKHLVRCTYECLEKAIAIVKPGVRFREVGEVINRHVSMSGLSVVKSYCGHGIGELFHCAPNIPHYSRNKAVGIMKAGQTFTIEPMVNAGKFISVHIL
ncbi:Methionine aminopeptidase 1A [Zea mays]|uniref:Methionine aminopeptidase n=1 Tax=Zea mays TaxID=4577 RepID=A0A317Y3T2_MAIZE|nr:Methionine aminopeptidase 1A [Zea mays]